MKEDNPHLLFALAFDPSSGRGWALERIYLVDSLDARGPTAPAELTAIVTFLFFRGRRCELGAFAAAPTGIPTVVPGQRLVGFRDMSRERGEKLQSVKFPPSRKATEDRREQFRSWWSR
jgi:hypothetical protein